MSTEAHAPPVGAPFRFLLFGDVLRPVGACSGHGVLICPSTAGLLKVRISLFPSVADIAAAVCSAANCTKYWSNRTHPSCKDAPSARSKLEAR